MPNYEHPEAEMFEWKWTSEGMMSVKAEIPDGRIVLCHADDEQIVRDAVALAQERPAWWEHHRMLTHAIEGMLRRRAE